MSFPKKFKYWATNYGREKFNNDVAQAKNKVERVSEIMKAVIENEDKNIGLYYRDRIDYEKTRDDLERAGLSDGFVLDETIAQMFAEIAAEQNIDDLQIISLNDPNIKEVVGADAIAGRAYHVGNGKVVIVAENLQDFADAMGTIAEEGRHIYHRNNNGLEDSEDYASFYGRQFENYFNKRAKDTPLYMIGSNLAYNAGQLGNDWENDVRLYYVTAILEAGKYLVGRKVYTLGKAIGDNGQTRYYFTNGTGIGVGLGAGSGIAVGGTFLKNTNNPEDIKDKGNSISLSFTGFVSFSISAEFSDGAKNSGLSGSLGSGGGASASVGYTRGKTIVARTIPELLSKVSIPNEKIRKKVIEEFKKFESKAR